MCAMSSRMSDSSSPPPPPDTLCHFKVLIPSAAVGCIMGKQGGVMSSMERVTRTKIVVSGVKDCYPGTRERVCLISGSIDHIMLANRIIMRKLRNQPHLCYPSSKGGNPKKVPDEKFQRPKQVKVIVPQSTASKIIGKNGNKIEQLKVNSGSVIQLSRKAFPVLLRERIVTISGELDSNDIACRLLLQIIAPDTDADFYKNVSYSEARYPLPSTFMTGSPFAANTNYTSNACIEQPVSAIERRDVVLYLDTFRETLRGMAFPEDVIASSCNAIMVLTDNKVLDLSLSMLINWFYPKAFSVYLKNGGLPGAQCRPTSSAAGESATSEMEQLCANSMFISKIETGEDQAGASGLGNDGSDDMQSDEDVGYDYDYSNDNWRLSKSDTWRFE